MQITKLQNAYEDQIKAASTFEIKGERKNENEYSE